MVEKVVEARKRSEDPKQEALREQKAVWNSAVSGFISKMITLKKAINGRGDIHAGLPPSSIKSPFPPAVSSYLHGLASEFSDIVSSADYVIKSQQDYSLTRRQSKKKADVMNEGFLVQGSWWGSRLWARMNLHGLPKEVRNIRLEMIRSSIYLEDQLGDLEDVFYSNDLNDLTKGINNLVVLSLGMTNTLLRKYERLLSINNVLPPEVEQGADYESPPASTRVETSEDGKANIQQNDRSVLGLPANKELKDFVLRMVGEYPIRQSLYVWVKSDPAYGMSQNDINIMTVQELQLKNNLLKFDFVSKTVGGEQTINMNRWAKKIIQMYDSLLEMVKVAFGRKYDVKKANTFSNLSDILKAYGVVNPLIRTTPAPPLIGIDNDVKKSKQEIEQEEKERQEKTSNDSDQELQKIAANVITRWVNRRLLRMSPSAENDIKLTLTEQIMKVMKLFDQLMDKLENKDASIDKVQLVMRELLQNYVSMLNKLKLFAKIFYLKQEEAKSVNEDPALKIKRTVFRDIDNIIAKLSLYLMDANEK